MPAIVTSGVPVAGQAPVPSPHAHGQQPVLHSVCGGTGTHGADELELDELLLLLELLDDDELLLLLGLLDDDELGNVPLLEDELLDEDDELLLLLLLLEEEEEEDDDDELPVELLKCGMRPFRNGAPASPTTQSGTHPAEQGLPIEDAGEARVSRARPPGQRNSE
ncbi:MAG TPA: hypothetical protein VEA69_21795 [Tepidisphaeraceae bacterium]|nr:hypothetical protein [Tepidisphaeraceae bacterium]